MSTSFPAQAFAWLRTPQKSYMGPPLVTLNQHYPFSHYVFVDADESHVAALKARSQAFALGSEKITLRGDCNDPQILRAVLKGTPSNALCLTFVDPFRFNIKFETIRALADARRTDFIIVFQMGGLKRALESGSPAIDSLFGDDGAWYKIYKESPRNFTRPLLDYYESRLSTLGYLEDFYPTEIPVRGPNNVLLYYLIFASKHPRGKDFWQKAIRKAEPGKPKLPGF